MHASSPLNAASLLSRRMDRRLVEKESGFSLVEVTMAIGVIAFAFVALLGLLPAGLTTFRQAIDTNNETRIVQTLVGRVQVMNFSELPNLDFEKSKEIYYFDEEGTLTDTASNPVPTLETARLYEAKVFIEEASKRDPKDAAKPLNFSTNVIVVFTNMFSAGAKEFKDIEQRADLDPILAKKKSDVKIRPILISKMDGTK